MTQTPVSRIKARRLERGLSQLAVATAAGISPSHYARIENGEVTPGVALALRIAELLRTTTEALWGGDDDTR